LFRFVGDGRAVSHDLGYERILFADHSIGRSSDMVFYCRLRYTIV
jgi:hypothetical protein